MRTYVRVYKCMCIYLCINVSFNVIYTHAGVYMFIYRRMYVCICINTWICVCL